MGGPHVRRICVLVQIWNVWTVCTTMEVCSNSILPGSKGDPGISGAEGHEGKMGKTGPPGQRGLMGVNGEKGNIGWMGKMGPCGARGDAGLLGTVGLPGLKGKPGTSCDCGRYRKVVAQMEMTINKLKNSVKFLKNVVLGVGEAGNVFFLLVKEGRSYREALVNCRLRGGALSLPTSKETHQFLAKFIAASDLTQVLTGLQVTETEVGLVYANGEARLNGLDSEWGPPGPVRGRGKCVQLSSAGAWQQVDCEAPHYYVCQFPNTWEKSANCTMNE